jgi:NTE family protein
MEQGVLPLTSASGRALGWPARDITGHKVGLALGTGAINGYAHIGVLHTLERWNVPIDFIAGTSIGSAVAAAYACGYPPAVCERILDEIGKKAFRVTIPRRAVLSNAGLREGIRWIARDRRIEDLNIPLAIIAADIDAGREVVFNRGLIWPAILASMAIPGVYPAVPVGGLMLVDGGVVNPVPSSIVSDMGAEVVIAVKLWRRVSDVPVEMESAIPSGSPPQVIQAITRSIAMMQGRIVTESAAAATVTIEPTMFPVAAWGLRSFGKGKPFIDAGRAAAEEALPRLAAAMPWLRA